VEVNTSAEGFGAPSSEYTIHKTIDLLGELVVVRVTGLEHETDTIGGPATVILADCWLVDDDGEPHSRKPWHCFGQVLRDDLRKMPLGGYFAGRIIQPNRAYVFTLDDDDRVLAARAVKTLRELEGIF
jgi:hypothetical protein